MEIDLFEHALHVVRMQYSGLTYEIGLSINGASTRNPV